MARHAIEGPISLRVPALVAEMESAYNRTVRGVWRVLAIAGLLAACGTSPALMVTAPSMPGVTIYVSGGPLDDSQKRAAFKTEFAQAFSGATIEDLASVPSGLAIDCTMDKDGAKIQVTDDGSSVALLAVGLACQIMKNRTTS